MTLQRKLLSQELIVRAAERREQTRHQGRWGAAQPHQVTQEDERQ